jgi:valyl-tRNA synthetase
MALNTELDRVRVYGDVADYVDDIARAMHVADLELLAEEPAVETVVTGIDLDYSVVGPEFGGDVPDIEAAIEGGEYVLEGEGDDATLLAGDHELTAEMFAVEEERRYDGDGDLLETDGAVVIVG